MSSSSFMPLSTFMLSLMKYQEPINWAELPSELTTLILIRLSVNDILDNAQKVCKQWRHICKDPLIWRKIDMRNHGKLQCDIMCRHAVDRSEGGLVEIHIWNFVNDVLLDYIVDRSRNLRTLGVGMCNPRMTNRGLFKAIAKLPLLETLEVSYCSCFKLKLIPIGSACPQLKTLKLNCLGPAYNPSRTKYDDDCNALAIAKSMPQLRHLQLIGNRLTDKGLNAILDGCPHLKHLDLRKCFNVNIVGDLEKRCFERIENFRLPKLNDSTFDHPFGTFTCE